MDPKDFYDSLKVHGIDFYCGVPDSLLKDFCAYVTAMAKPEDHVITSNEGSAIAMAAGYHMATHKPALVYLQVKEVQRVMLQTYNFLMQEIDNK